MATLKEQAATDINMFVETGLPWVYQAVFTPQIGDPVSLNVVFEQEQYLEFEGIETKASGLQYRIEALLADLGQTPIAKTATRPGDFFTIDSVKYEVTGITDQNNNFITCSVRVIDG